jgi:tRNA (guanine-N7-)-methyltransferase
VKSVTKKKGVSRRTVRSFVLRGGRLTDGQKRGLDELWPRFGIEKNDSMLDFKTLFGNHAPVIMEIGFGNGDATWKMAQACPAENYLGVEVHLPGVGHLLLKMKQHGIRNIRLSNEDAVDFLRDRIPQESLAGVRIYFPDPWPKKRHHKRRLIQPAFIELLALRMCPGALLHLATDWEPYAEHMLEVMRSTISFENLSPSGDFCDQPEWRPETKYERRGDRLGHQVRDLLFKRIPPPNGVGATPALG